MRELIIMIQKKFSDIDDYISNSSNFSVETQKILKKIRQTIKKNIPLATETISYNMPAFKDEKIFIYFAGFKKHIGIYPPVKNKKLRQKLKPYSNEKGNLAFKLDEEIPYQLIGEIAKSLWEQSH